MITDDIAPEAYRHWVLGLDPPVATLTLLESGGPSGVRPPGHGGPLAPLLRADLELADAVQRLRFEHPDVRVVVVTGAGNAAFSTGLPDVPAGAPPHLAAAVRTLREEVHLAIEDAGADSGQHWLSALNGPAGGPGYELALATDDIVLIDDGRSSVSLPAVSGCGDLLAPRGLLRLAGKRHVRPDLLDAFCCSADGVGGQRAVDWGLVDVSVPARCFTDSVTARAQAAAAGVPGGTSREAVELGPLRREEFDGGFAYPNLRVEVDDGAGEAAVTIVGPPNHECFAPEPGPRRLRARWWPLAVCRELDDALLVLRSRTPEVRTVVLRTEGDPLAVASADVALTSGYERDWFVREVVLFWKRTLRRLDGAWQSVITLVEPGSCFVGTLLELALASDRIYMLDGPAPADAAAPPEIFLTGMNFGLLPQANGLTRLEARFRSRAGRLAALADRVGDPLAAGDATGLGLVTGAVVPAEWEATIRRAIEERAALPFEVRAWLAAARCAGRPETQAAEVPDAQPPGSSGTSR